MQGVSLDRSIATVRRRCLPFPEYSEALMPRSLSKLRARSSRMYRLRFCVLAKCDEVGRGSGLLDIVWIFLRWDTPIALALLLSRPVSPKSLFIVSPNFAGWLTIVTPACSRALIFSSASGSPGTVKAPAWPITRPGAALTPPINPAIGL